MDTLSTYAMTTYPPRIVALILVLSGVLAACAGAPKTAAPTPAPPATSVAPATPSPTLIPTPDEAAIRAGIQETLDIYARAYNENNVELLKQVVDQSNLPFRRLVQQRFDDFQKSFQAGQVTWSFHVKSVIPHKLGFISAHVERYDGLVADWLFRYIDNAWQLSEPTKEQIGKRQKVMSDHFTFYMYPWSDDLTPTIIDVMEQARTTVLTHLGKVPDQKPDIYIQPIYGVASNENPLQTAYYDFSLRTDIPDRIIISAPYSFRFGFYDSAIGWKAHLLLILTHEYTHLVNNRSFTPTANMADWMIEGLAQYVARDKREQLVRNAVKS